VVFAVDLDDRITRMQGDAAARVPDRPVQHDVVGLLLAGQHRRQQDAVVIAARLGAEHGDGKAIRHAQFQQLFHGTHAGHAIAGHHQADALVRARNLDLHLSVLHARRVRRHAEGGIFDATARAQHEVMLVDGRSHHAFVLQVAGEPARQHIGA
jgi:hypothetical protein